MESSAVLLEGSVLDTGEAPSLLMDNRLYVPLSPLVEQMSGALIWDADTKQAEVVTAAGDRFAFAADDYGLTLNDTHYWMEAAPFLHEYRLYFPLRDAAQLLHAKLEWNEATKQANIVPVARFGAEPGATVASLAAAAETTPLLLIERNGWAADTHVLGGGVPVSTVVPDLMSDKLAESPAVTQARIEAERQARLAAEEEQRRKAEEEARAQAEREAAARAAREAEAAAAQAHKADEALLARIIQVEAGYESYQSQLAVGSVIMNRVNSSRFPNTIKDVIYQRGQFPPAHNGLLDASVAGANAKKAAAAVLKGENNVPGALFFYNPAVTGGKYWDALTLVKEIGNHRYVK
ncbi:cell wall hydrolase [Paenibacillus sp. IB182496]|uniref:Cell wall hydrolase n=1 Tax=Paenibacillus sabuli TaxID=2772509 RepID=A0A927GRI8_9BACL|nr:cell wall hydrolase [Paenibacillus sabuli]MBD2845025.1 cell wall hydrolase [Paenibacillus sabuli]